MAISKGSLRTRLLKVIILPLIFAVVALTIARFFEAKTTTQKIYDNALLSVAHVIARDVALSEGDLLAEQLLETLTDALGDQIFYHVAGEDGSAFVVGYTNPPKPSSTDQEAITTPLFFNANYRGDPVRVIAFREFIAASPYGDWVKVTVWQTTRQRESLALNLASRSFTIALFMMTATAVFAFFGVHYGLKPLYDLQDAIEIRSPEDIGEIRRPVPREVFSIVTAMNDLFHQLRCAFAEKDAFIANAAHQLRNPVAGIQSQAEAAVRAKTPEELLRRVADVATAAKHASRLTEQLLSMERVSRKSLRSHFKKLDIVSELQSILAEHAAPALRKNIELSLYTTLDRAMVNGNTTLLREVFENLIDNAMRYNDAETPSIVVEITADKHNYTINIIDNGKGIANEIQPTLFERFTRGVEDGSGGCGLGLTIAKTIVEGHRGVITLTSSSAGTTLAVIIPILEGSRNSA